MTPLLLAALWLAPLAQDTTAADTAARSRAAVLEEFVAQERRTVDAPVLPAGSTLEALASLDSLTAATYLNALRSVYDYQIIGFRHRARLFRWQLVSSVVIFVMVQLLVITGVLLSYLQFRRGWNQLESQIELSAAGIKLQSSVIGLIILVVSLAFFYLYLVHVYPIREII
jgi:hypothetical protein